MTTKQKKLPFKMGADPEFTFVALNKRIDANSLLNVIFPTAERGNNGFEFGTAGNLGWDNHPQTAEIRPSPSDQPIKIIQNIEKLLKQIYDRTNLFDMTTLSDFAPIGGHIHIEVPDEIKQDTQQSTLFHRKLATFYTAIMAGDNPLNLQKRANGGYGKLTDFRVNNKTYEFRAPSAEWLTTPKIAKATLAYLGVVANEIIYNHKNFNKHDKLIFKSDKGGNSYQEMAILNLAVFMDGFKKAIKNAIQNFELYEPFKTEIDYMFQSTQILKDKEKVNYNIIKGWGLDKAKPKITKALILSDKTTTEKQKIIDIDTLSEIIPILYNNDTNIAYFSKELRKKLCALKWTLKNKYFFYGLRAGMKDFIVHNSSKQIIYHGEQIKSKKELHYLKDELFNRIQKKLTQNNIIINAKEKYTFVGIPFKMRKDKNLKPFITMIYNIETGKIKAPNIKEFTKKQKGPITKYYIEKDNEPQKKKVIKKVKTQKGVSGYTATTPPPQTAQEIRTMINRIEQD